MESLTPGYSFGMRMEYVRADLGMTKTAMAKSIKVTPGTLSSYENDKTFPRKETISLFCRLYHINTEWLMTNEGEIYLSQEEISSEKNREKEIRKITIEVIKGMGISEDEAESLYDSNRQKYAHMEPEAFSLFITLMINKPC